MTTTSAATDRAEFLDGVRIAVRGVTEKFDRAYHQREAEAGGTGEELWRTLAEKNLLGVGVPEDLGGVGGGLSGAAALMEEMSAAGVQSLFYAITTFSREAISRHGTADQIARFVAPTITGERRLCFGVTEPDAGTNSFAMRTRAQRNSSGGYTINGQKAFISGADAASHIVLVTRTAAPGEAVGRTNGFTLFVVDLDTPGIELQQMEMVGVMPERQYEVFFQDVEVPEDARIGEEGMGFSYLFDCLNQERVLIAAGALGLGEFVLAKGVEYAKGRAPFGTPIGAYQSVAHPLARAKVDLEAARLMIYQAAADYDDGEPAGVRANMAKLLATTACHAAFEASVRAHGGYAYVKEYDLGTLWAAVRAQLAGPVNNESLLGFIAERVLGLPKNY